MDEHPRLYALDTEFIEDGSTIALLSLALVGTDGREYYAQVVDAPYPLSNPWVRQHVLPHLTPCPSGETRHGHWGRWKQATAAPACVPGCPWRWTSVMAPEIRAFVGTSPLFLTYYGAYDWVAFCQLYGALVDLPQGWPMFAYDLRVLLNIWDYEDVFQPDEMPHHALHDARWIMETFKQYAPRPFSRHSLFGAL